MNPFPGTESLSEQEDFSLRRYSFLLKNKSSFGKRDMGQRAEAGRELRPGLVSQGHPWTRDMEWESSVCLSASFTQLLQQSFFSSFI